MYPTVFPVIKKVLIYFSGIMDVERQNGIKKWILTAQREGMKNGTLDMVLRIFCNAPKEGDVEALREWKVEVAKVFWIAAERRIECKELDNMCGH